MYLYYMNCAEYIYRITNFEIQVKCSTKSRFKNDLQIVKLKLLLNKNAEYICTYICYCEYICWIIDLRNA